MKLAGFGAALAVLVVCVQGCGGGPPLEPWHTVTLAEEFTAGMARDGGEVRSFDDYLVLERELRTR